MYTKLTLVGHVHNRPEQTITSTYSWPQGKDYEEVEGIISEFERSFTFISCELE